jgi:hypothetical protein
MQARKPQIMWLRLLEQIILDFPHTLIADLTV